MEVVEIDNRLIALRIRTLRRQKQWTQQELADRCNFPGLWKISRIEGAKKGSGIERIDTLDVICETLGIELWELLKPDGINEYNTQMTTGIRKEDKIKEYEEGTGRGANPRVII